MNRVSHRSAARCDSVLEALFPRMTLRRHVKPAALRELFERSGYFALRDGGEPSPQWYGLSADELSRDFVYLSGERPIGHGSITRAYGTTWIAHQIATLSHQPETLDARRSLYLALSMVPTLIDGARARVLAYFDRGRPWHRMFFEQFTSSVPASQAVIANVCRFERSDVPLEGAPCLPSHMEIGQPSAAELVQVTQMARRSLPALMCDALELTPDRLQTDELHPSYRAYDLARERKVWVAREHGRVVAAALSEHTGRELSLFNIMNLSYMFVATPDVPAILQRALQHQVRASYLARGIRDPLLVAPEDNFDGTHDPHVRLAEVMGCITWSAAGLAAYASHIRERAAWLEQSQKSAAVRAA
jgi:hypothetical protein